MLGINDEYKINVKFTPTLNFMKKLIKYIKPENYTIAPTHIIKLQDSNIITYKQSWLNIKIIYDDIQFNIISNISLTFEKLENDVNLINFKIKNKNKDNKDNEHKIELELVSTIHNENMLHDKFNNFIYHINNT